MNHFINKRITGNAMNIILTVFYAVVATFALVGQTEGATTWLHWAAVAALPAVATVELGGIALSAYADTRRRLGERAIAARFLSAAVAAFAVALNWFGHADHMRGGFFAGLSVLGYLVWILHSGARRRDQMRADGKLARTTPVYGVARWLAHPGKTWRARTAALESGLDLFGSLADVDAQDKAATAARRDESRKGLVAKVIEQKLRAAAVSPLDAQLAVAVFDLNRVAETLTASADYDGLAGFVMADLVPSRMLGDTAATQAAQLVQAVDAVLPVAPVSPAPLLPVASRVPQAPRAPRMAVRVSGGTTALPAVPSLLNPGRELVGPRTMKLTAKAVR